MYLYAVENDAIEAVKILLEAGADRRIGNKRGILPIDTARRLGHKDILYLLEN